MKKILLIFPLFLIFCGCHQETTTDDLSCIQITDRNGLCETISLQDKINKFKQIDYSTPQPYKKIIRVFKKDDENKAKSIITSYHSNGQLHKYLEAFDGRAFGKFIEKHQNGQLQITANVIGGTANFDENSQTCKSYCHYSCELCTDDTLLPCTSCPSSDVYFRQPNPNEEENGICICLDGYFNIEDDKTCY